LKTPTAGHRRTPKNLQGRFGKEFSEKAPTRWQRTLVVKVRVPFVLVMALSEPGQAFSRTAPRHLAGERGLCPVGVSF